MALKYKIGDCVRIKSLDWYNENKDEGGYINCGSRAFFTKMSDWCGKILTINRVVEEFKYYCVSECIFSWTDEMIEGLVEEEVSYDIESEWLKHEISLPEGYIFKDENGNVINATKIVLEKKKKEYPKLFVDCCAILYHNDNFQIVSQRVKGHKGDLLFHFQKLLICRDAYWQIAGAEMGLGKPWEPDWNIRGYYAIARSYGNVVKTSNYNCDLTFVFPTEEMRDAFYEAFKKEIEICKELL